jgi:hypothetical protein
MAQTKKKKIVGLCGWPDHPQGTKKKKKKKSLTFGGGRTTPSGHGVASTTPNQLWPLGVVQPPPTPKLKKKKKKKKKKFA